VVTDRSSLMSVTTGIPDETEGTIHHGHGDEFGSTARDLAGG
jgi:hypothetical protein